MSGEHWTVEAQERSREVLAMSHPVVGLLAAGDDGGLYAPAGFNGETAWWWGDFNPRNPRHWLPYLRSRLTRRLIWIECES